MENAVERCVLCLLDCKSTGSFWPVEHISNAVETVSADGVIDIWIMMFEEAREKRFRS